MLFKSLFSVPSDGTEPEQMQSELEQLRTDQMETASVSSVAVEGCYQRL